MEYGEKVRSLTYTERANNIAPSIFSVLEQFRPRSYILPHLRQLTWKAETPAGLARCSLFLNPELRELDLEIGPHFKHLDVFLQDVSNRTKLTSISITSPTGLPDTFTDILARQDALEKLVLVAPGALSPDVGRWASSLQKLHTLQLDLTGRSIIAVEGFFDDIPANNGWVTPSNDGSSDSGVFSEEDLDMDFTEIRKSSLALTGDLRTKSAFAHLRQLQLTGDVANIAVFLRHLRTDTLTQLDLVIEDPPQKVDWQDLSVVISERFGQTLQSFRVTATNSSRFSDLVRSTSRGDAPARHLTFEHFTAMPRLVRLEVDLPESIIFHNADLSHLSRICRNIESLKLCPTARFPSATAPPWLTMEGLAPLTANCKRLHTLAVVLNAKPGTAKVLTARHVSSRSLVRLHVGHSWIGDPLHVAILLSHLAPHLNLLKFFHEKNRPGYVEANVRAWTMVSEYLPHLQNMRLVERQHTPARANMAPATYDKGIEARPVIIQRGVDANPSTADASIQSSPVLFSQEIETIPELSSVTIDAIPLTAELSVGTETETETEEEESNTESPIEPLQEDHPSESPVAPEQEESPSESAVAPEQELPSESLVTPEEESPSKSPVTPEEESPSESPIIPEESPSESPVAPEEESPSESAVTPDQEDSASDSSDEPEEYSPADAEPTETMITMDVPDIIDVSENEKDDSQNQSRYYMIPTVVSFVSSACKTIFFIPLYIPTRIYNMSLATIYARRTGYLEDDDSINEKTSEEPLDISPVCL